MVIVVLKRTVSEGTKENVNETVHTYGAHLGLVSRGRFHDVPHPVYAGSEPVYTPSPGTAVDNRII